MSQSKSIFRNILDAMIESRTPSGEAHSGAFLQLG